MHIPLSIVILHHGDPKSVTLNLQSLRDAYLPEGTEVLVINNGYKGANARIPIKPNPDFNLRYFEIPNKGYPQGNNFGLNLAGGEYLCILNPDVEVSENTFGVLLDYMKKNPKVGICAPRLRYPDGKIQDNFRVFPRLLDHLIKRTFLRYIFFGRMRKYLMWGKDPQKNEPVDWLTGAFHLFNRKSWEDLGPNNEKYFLFMSDVEICRKAWAGSWEVHFVGDTEVRHNDARLSAGGLLDLLRKKLVWIHIWDAVKYYVFHINRDLPKRAPSCRKN